MELVHQLSIYDQQGLFILIVGFGAVIISSIAISMVCGFENWKLAVGFIFIIMSIYIFAVIRFYQEPRPQTFNEAYTIIKRSKTLELKSKDENQQSAIIDIVDEDEKTYVVRYKGESYIIPKEQSK